jgi:hypothetical protein
MNTKKQCGKCKNILDLSLFSKNRTKKDGLDNYCKKCASERTLNWVSNNTERHKNNQIKARRKRTEKGLCKYCLKKSLKHNNLCLEHWYRNVSWNHFKVEKYWEGLKAIAEKQDYKCVYTDETLIPGLNMGLDHKKSQKNNPELKDDIANLQWVTKKINVIKNELSHDEFIDLCNAISKKFTNTDGQSGINACGDGSLEPSLKQEKECLVN